MTMHPARIVAGTLVLIAGMVAGSQGMAQGACTATTEAAGRSCTYEVRADWWLALGICSNKSTDALRQACADQALEDRREAVVLCGEQFEARDDLCDQLGEQPYAPRIDPANFVARINNPLLPLRPGSRWVYRGETDDGLERVVVSVLNETETILGVRCTVVRDTVTIDGELVEDTIDWYAIEADKPAILEAL